MQTMETNRDVTSYRVTFSVSSYRPIGGATGYVLLRLLYGFREESQAMDCVCCRTKMKMPLTIGEFY